MKLRMVSLTEPPAENVAFGKQVLQQVHDELISIRKRYVSFVI